jgi:hypothetical protein
MKPSLDSIFDQVLDSGDYCDDCPFANRIQEPHGEVTFWCGARKPQECQGVATVMKELNDEWFS